jgi:hypothetical protein
VIARADVARFLVDQIADPGRIGRAVVLIDRAFPLA